MKVKFTLNPLQLEVESTPRREVRWRGGHWPDPLYRRAARRKITELIDENRHLRHGRLPKRSRRIETLFVMWLDRRYPVPIDTGHSTPEEIRVVEAGTGTPGPSGAIGASPLRWTS